MNQKSNRTLLVVGIVALFIAFLCVGTLGGLAFVKLVDSQSLPTSLSLQTQNVDMRALEQRPIGTPAPLATIVVQPIFIPEGGDIETEILTAIYQKVNPSVVNVRVQVSLQSVHPQVTPEVPDDFFQEGQGSGFVWNQAGYIVTNRHVIEGAEEIDVTFYDDVTVLAEIVGSDVDSDLAVIKVDPSGLELVPVEVGRIEDLIVGQRAIAIGNPFGFEGSLTSGIISALGRTIPTADTQFNIPDVIQTDAAINPGNSGGPLLNAQGQVIGVNTQIRSEVRANSGVGFAVPVSIVARVIPALIEQGFYEHPYMGISGSTLTPAWADVLGLDPQLRGAYVNVVIQGEPAARAGLKGGSRSTGILLGPGNPLLAGGDLIIGVDEQTIRAFDDILVYLERYRAPGDRMDVHVLRNGREMTITMTLGSRP